MKYHHVDTVDFPLEEVWPVYRNQLLELLDYLPNIRKIVELECEDTKGVKRITLQWYAKAKLPGPAARLIPESALTWVDKAVWHDDQHAVEYELILIELTKAARVVGRNTFEDIGGKTRVTLNGEIKTDINKLGLAPKILLRAVIPVVEAFAVQMVKPNLEELNRGVEKFLREKKNKGRGRRKKKSPS